MKTSLTILGAGLLALVLTACGGGGDISGSQCGLIDCSTNELTCHYYPAPYDAYRIFYKRTLQEGWEYTAILNIELNGLDDPTGTQIVDQEFLQRVDLYRPPPGEQWPEYDGGKLVIKNAGREEGKTLKGKASFQFINGYFASFAFNCSVEIAQPD